MAVRAKFHPRAMAGMPCLLLLYYFTLIGDGVAAGHLLNEVCHSHMRTHTLRVPWHEGARLCACCVFDAAGCMRGPCACTKGSAAAATSCLICLVAPVRSLFARPRWRC